MWKQFVGVLLLCALVVATVLGGVIGYSWMQARASAIQAPDMATFQTLSEANIKGVGAGSGGARKTRKEGDAQKDSNDQAKNVEKDATLKKADDKKPDATKPDASGANTPDKEKKDQTGVKKDNLVEKKDQPTKEGAAKPAEASKDAGKTEPVKAPEKSGTLPATEKSDPKSADPAAKKPPEENKKPS